ncbi:hypothetical protein [Undibacterium flavidum]|uniref:Uncharacterized protein n=1 Tax=Undibacterium flavidum TaxID=2762297 RepID=A0ABR6YGX7_9BURK|nr:hypothetical protein [Undibacterium flavidum]MBC3875840.1 hypothetical protein [Undibacterium flavidum]
MIDFSEMLPVGMVAHGGQVAQIMAEIAKRQRGLADWEAFHYEKISDSAVELTGGIVSITNGAKRWLEPHDCITISFAAVIAEMQHQGLLETVPEANTVPAKIQALNNDRTMLNTASNAHYPYLHLKLALPDDPLSRQKLLQTLHLQADLMGATIIGCSLE